MQKMLNIVGQTSGYLTAVQPTNKRSGGYTLWECVCTCGKNTCPKIIYIRSCDLTSGNTRSCRCQQYNKSIHPAIRSYFSNVRSNACYRNRDYVFELTLDQFISIIRQPCRYCNANNDIKRVSGRNYTRWALRANGIDRWDNTIGYTVENSVPCCETCNYAKRSMTGQEYINHCKNVVAHNYDGNTR